MVVDQLIFSEYSDADKAIIKRTYRKLERELEGRNLKPEKKKLVEHAFKVACKAHVNDRRKSGEPYITHPIEVALIVAKEMGLGATSVACALLHDTVEDTEITLENIKDEFGEKIATIIDGLTKISEVVDITAGSIQALNFRKILLTITDDIRVIIVKLADRLHNMRTLGSMRRDKQLKIANETLFLYAPLAHRFGFYSVKSELEDLCLRYTEPEAYAEIEQKLKDTKASRKKYIESFIAPLQKSLEATGLKYRINGRPKHIYSIFNKIKKKGVAFEDLYDLFAIRIILDSEVKDEKVECWRVYSIVTDFYKPNPDRIKDFISNPKTNGYESLHTTVMGPKGRWVEVQVRTERMHSIAEQGVAAHWKYKEGDKSKEGALDLWIQHVREILENPEADAIEFVNTFKSELFEDEIYTFTPKGDVFMLPKGATALDFAFAIHTQVGSSCIGAKVHHKLVPISYELQNGDQVEILTSSTQQPNEGWLKIVKTSKAKSRIKGRLKEERKVVAEDGKEILMRKLKSLKIASNHENFHEITNYYNLKNTLDLFYEIAIKNIDLTDLKLFSIQGDKIIAPKEEKRTKDVKLKGNIRESYHQNAGLTILGSASANIQYTFSKCCNPIPGDEVFGFVTIGKGVKIHRTSCPNAADMMTRYGYRIAQVSWNKNRDISFLSALHVKGFDGKGLVNKITKIISVDMDLDMKSLNIDTEDGIFEGEILIYVNDTKEMANLRNKIIAMDGIIECSRV